MEEPFLHCLWRWRRSGRRRPTTRVVSSFIYFKLVYFPLALYLIHFVIVLRYVIISREIFNPMYALFTTSPGDRVTYMINSASHCNSNHLCYFKFVGRVIAKAIYDNKLLECYFTRSFYKHILGKCVRYTDMESEDYSFYQVLSAWAWSRWSSDWSCNLLSFFRRALPS